MLRLCSDGWSSKRLVSAVAPLVGKGGSSPLAVTAEHPYKEKGYRVPRSMEEPWSVVLVLARDKFPPPV